MLKEKLQPFFKIGVLAVALVVFICIMIIIGINKKDKKETDPTNVAQTEEEIVNKKPTLVVPSLGEVSTNEPIKPTNSGKYNTHTPIYPNVILDFLTPNENSRPQTPIEKIQNIVVHYVGNPNTSAQANRNYFESLATTGAAMASSHYVVGLEGEVIQCIPLNEKSYASNHRNKDTISIETCHPDETGKFNGETYNSLVKITAWLCNEFDLTSRDVIRHYDVTGKICPKYYVENEDEWWIFIEAVDIALREIKTEK